MLTKIFVYKKTKIVKRKNVEKKKKKITVNIHINFSHKFIFP